MRVEKATPEVQARRQAFRATHPDIELHITTRLAFQDVSPAGTDISITVGAGPRCALAALLADLHGAALQYRCRFPTRRSGSKYNPQFKHLRCPARAIVSPGSVEQNGHANRAAAQTYARRKRKHAKKIG
jgi:hypothetical protein